MDDYKIHRSLSFGVPNALQRKQGFMNLHVNKFSRLVRAVEVMNKVLDVIISAYNESKGSSRFEMWALAFLCVRVMLNVTQSCFLCYRE